MPSFDIVSKTDLTEVDNALRNIEREIATRFDFKGSQCKIERVESTLTVLADDQPKMKQMHELLKAHLTRRKVEASALDFKEPERASGDKVRQVVIVKQGIIERMFSLATVSIQNAAANQPVRGRALSSQAINIPGQTPEGANKIAEIVRSISLTRNSIQTGL